MRNPESSSVKSFLAKGVRRNHENLFVKLYSGHRSHLFLYGIGAAVEGLLEASALGIIGVVAIALANSETNSVALWGIGSVSFQGGLLVFCGLILTRLLVGLGTAFIATGLACRISLDKRLDLLRGYSEARFERNMKISAADLQQMLGSWPHQAGSQGSSLVSQAANILVVASMFAVAFISNPLLAIISISFVAVFFALFQPLRSYIRRLSRRVIRSEQETAESVDELANLQTEAVLFGVAKQLRSDAAIALEKEISSRRRASFVKATVSPFYTALALGSVGVFLIVVVNSSLDLANLAPTLLIVIRALGYGQSIQHLGSSFASLGPLLGKLDELQKEFDQNKRIHGDAGLKSFESLELFDVSAKYEGLPVLDGITFNVKRGDIVGLVGPSGGGKTTLLRVISGQLSRSGGSIKVNGVELEGLSENRFAQIVASVPQFPRLMSRSIDENVTFMRSSISATEIDRALRLAALDRSSIELTEPGSALRAGQPTISGGQAQRIGLARALAGRPSLLLLDEPTSAVDGRAQDQIVESIESLGHEAGIIIVSHRPEILRCCTAIYVIEDGQIVAGGGWSEVFEMNLYFREMMSDG